MNASEIQDTLRLWEVEPEKAKGKPAVMARDEDRQAVLAFGSFTWRADLAPALGGSGQAPSPTALLLSALAGCAVVFIKDTLAPQLGVHLQEVEAVASCEADSRGLLGMAGAVADLSNLEIKIAVTSDDSEANLQRLFQVWQERCPIYLALTKPMEVHMTVETKRSGAPLE